MKPRSILIAGLTIVALITGIASAAYAQNIGVVIDGRSVDFAGSPPFMQNGSVLVPLRGVFEQLGAGVNYNNETRTIEATKGQIDVILRLGQSTAYINGQAQPLLQPPLVVNGSTFVPLRFVAQSFGAIVNWSDATQTVDIRTAGGASPVADNGGAAPVNADNGPEAPVAAPTGGGESQDAGSGPIRLARFSNVDGNVSWRPTADTDWSPASPNIPLREGAQIWASDGGRAEIQFDDGSWLRLGRDAVAVIEKLHSDSNGEFTQIQLSQGTASLALRADHSVYQIDTTFVSVKAPGPAKLRVDASNGVEISVRQGSAEVIGSAGKERLEAGSYLRMASAGDMYNIGGLPGSDDWDRWSDSRDAYCDHPDRSLPPNIGLVAGDLDNFGDWRDDPQYGRVWCPRVQDPNWRPYSNGHWVWVHPFGWTWVAAEPWGWAPYHYGTWVQEPYGWSWVPGPRQQYWSPAVVHFSEYHNNVCWAPLAPSEVHYPPHINIALHGRDWSLNFSIGGCAVYYPTDSHTCEPRPWNNRQVNNGNDEASVRNIYNNTTINNRTQNVYTTKYVFVPANGAAGATSTASATFGHAGQNRPITDPTNTAFKQGRSVGAPPVGKSPVGGPVGVKPTRESLTPTRTFAPAPPQLRAVIAKPVFHAPAPIAVAPKATPVVIPTPQPVTTPKPQPIHARKPQQAPLPIVVAPKPAPVVAPAPRPVTAPTPQPVHVRTPQQAPPPAPVAPKPAPVVTPTPRPVTTPGPVHPVRPTNPTPAPVVAKQTSQIAGFSPTSGKQGTVVTITGSNLDGISALTFNNVPASFNVKSSTTVTAVVPAGVKTGPITIKSPNGTAASPSNFYIVK